MFFGSEGKSAIFRSSPIDHADVFVGVGDAMDVEKAGSNQGAGAGRGRGRPFADEFDFEATFLFGLAEGGLFGIFVEFDVAAEGEPFVEFAMVNEKNIRVANNEDCDCEIDFFVNMSHADL